jgi:hypothetical protein
VDTRNKIISNGEARTIRDATIVSGYFDPVTSTHAERLQGLKEAGRPLLVLIATPADPILPPQARAQLIAALACVDHVTIIGAVYPEGLNPHTQLETEHAAQLDKLIQHVHKRQQAGQQ